jgi:hypothetical protein
MDSAVKNYSNYNSRKRAIIKEIRDTGYVTDGSPETMDILFECISEGYVTGYDLQHNVAGNVIGQEVNPRVTGSGLKFLSRSDLKQRIIWSVAVPIVVAVVVSIVTNGILR